MMIWRRVNSTTPGGNLVCMHRIHEGKSRMEHVCNNDPESHKGVNLMKKNVHDSHAMYENHNDLYLKYNSL